MANAWTALRPVNTLALRTHVTQPVRSTWVWNLHGVTERLTTHGALPTVEVTIIERRGPGGRVFSEAVRPHVVKVEQSGFLGAFTLCVGETSTINSAQRLRHGQESWRS